MDQEVWNCSPRVRLLVHDTDDAYKVKLSGFSTIFAKV